MTLSTVPGTFGYFQAGVAISLCEFMSSYLQGA